MDEDGDIYLGDYNDKHSLAHNAKVWNALGRELDYNVIVDVIDPEAE